MQGSVVFEDAALGDPSGKYHYNDLETDPKRNKKPDIPNMGQTLGFCEQARCQCQSLKGVQKETGFLMPLNIDPFPL